jgi:type VI protein secretion system component VasF
MAVEQSMKRNSLRQQEIVDDTAKLLSLAQQLKTEVDKSNKDMLSIAVVKKAEEIEKLAKSVKEKMRAGQ